MGTNIVSFTLEIDREEDGRWIADVIELPGVMAYGATQEEAMAKAEAIALRVLADKIEESRNGASMTVSFAAA